MDYNEHTISILRRLFNKERIGGRHTEEKNCLRWVKNLPPKEYKQTIKDWERCIKDGLVIRLKKTGELHVSLNPRMLKEIHELII